MYKLYSSDYDNYAYRNGLTKHPELIEHYTRLNTGAIREVIYHSEYTKNVLDNIFMTLTLGDELSDPISYKEAKILFFVACNNYTQHKKIRNFAQARLLYDSCNGAYLELARQPEEKTIEHCIHSQHRCLLPGITLIWKFPVMEYYDGKLKCKMYSIAGANRAPFAKLAIPQLGLTDIAVPRAIYMQFFENSYRTNALSVTDPQEFYHYFDEYSVAPLLNTLIAIGLHRVCILDKLPTIRYEYDEKYQQMIAYKLQSNIVLDEDWADIDDRRARFIGVPKYLPVVYDAHIDIYS